VPSGFRLKNAATQESRAFGLSFKRRQKYSRASCVSIEPLLCSNYLFFRNFYPKTASHFSEVALAFVRNISDDAAFLAAGRHARRVKFFKRALPLIALLMVAVFSWFTFFVSPPPADILTLNTELDGANKLVMVQPRIEGYNRDRQPYALSALRAIQDPARSGMIELEEITATLPLGERGAAKIQAQGGIFDNINGRMSLPKPFRIETDTGVVADFLSADINIATSQLVSNERIEIRRQGELLTAQHLRIIDEGKTFIFEGNVRLLIAGQ